VTNGNLLNSVFQSGLLPLWLKRRVLQRRFRLFLQRRRRRRRPSVNRGGSIFKERRRRCRLARLLDTRERAERASHRGKVYNTRTRKRFYRGE